MPAPYLEDVFKTNGVPTYTFVEPVEYRDLILNLRTAGRGLVVEGPSGIGKTTAVETALQRVGIADRVTKLSARNPEHVEYIELLPEMKDVGVIIVDDFHKLEEGTRRALADFIKTLADREDQGTKVIIIGINRAGANLISFAHDLVNRIDVVRFESNPDEKVQELLAKGAAALNVTINVADEIVEAAQGSFYIAQMLAREVCKRAGVMEYEAIPRLTEESFEAVRSDVWDRLSMAFKERCVRFCRGNKMRREGRAPYLHILRWLAEGSEWTLDLREAMRHHPEMKGSIGQVVDKDYLRDLIAGDDELQAVMHFGEENSQLTVEDPQFIYFIRNIAWKSFAAEVGFLSLEFASKYDFAMSFAGEERAVAEAIVRCLEDSQVEVFYDKNEQHRILALDVEEYLRPIYQSEARFVVALLSRNYPRKVWTKFESEQFKDRFGQHAVIPIWFSDAPPGMFDKSRDYGGLDFDVARPVDEQAEQIAQMLLRKLGDDREQAELALAGA